ncbi:INO80 complex subunit B [Sipha flava]|uniref:INO80 complex subunit B n=1 Tax=Sipha flava TaxID=143950 RepID=A0A2S2QIY9_9HEMI|nr:INO80 complex subunit B [Sipha flava]XP_025422113.1 INO80 complex subunit B [Sipha flava]XP_025422114.1 INO80 complex subunit B [Sipha flava]
MSGNDEYVDVMTSSPPHTTRTTLQSPGMKKKKVKSSKDDPGSSDEERWLKAIETGKLDEVDDELKKITKKDPKMMTARQRAMFDRKTDNKEFTEELVALPSGYREKILTPEMLQKKAIKSQKRKQQADEKRENDKKRTMERLLKKHESKSKSNSKGRMAKKDVNNIVYISKDNNVSLLFPEGMDFPLKSSTIKPPPAQQMCGLDGCKNPKKYSCSRTGLPLCSLQCYVTNRLNIWNAVC